MGRLSVDTSNAAPNDGWHLLFNTYDLSRELLAREKVVVMAVRIQVAMIVVVMVVVIVAGLRDLRVIHPHEMHDATLE